MAEYVIGKDYDFESLRDTPINQQIYLPAQKADCFIRHREDDEVLFCATIRHIEDEKLGE